MDDLRSTLADFDPDAPLPGMPDPWDFMPTPADRPGPPWAMAEMIAAEPGLASRVAERVVADGSAAALAALSAARLPRAIRWWPPDAAPRSTRRMGAAAILRDAWRSEGLRGRGPVAAQAFELALDPPAGGLVIGISHEGGTAATIAAMAAGRAHGASTALITGSAASPAAARADVTARDGRDGPRLVPHGRLPVADRRGGGGRLGSRGRPSTPGRSGRASSRASRPRTPRAATARARTRPSPRPSPPRRTCSSSAPARTGSPHASSRSRSRRPRGCPSAIRDLETFLHGHLPATGAETRWSLVLTERARPRRPGQARPPGARRGRLARASRPAAILGADAAALIPDALTPGGRIVVPEAPDLAPACASLLGAAGPLQLVTLAIAAARGTNPDLIRREDPRYLRAAELADDPNG